MLPESPAFLWDACEAATKAASIAQGHGQAEYLGDWVLQAAVERQLEILGEALKNLRTADAATAARIPNVHAIIATRNILVHAYAQVDQRRVWEGESEPAVRPLWGRTQHRRLWEAPDPLETVGSGAFSFSASLPDEVVRIAARTGLDVASQDNPGTATLAPSQN